MSYILIHVFRAFFSLKRYDDQFCVQILNPQDYSQLYVQCILS